MMTACVGLVYFNLCLYTCLNPRNSTRVKFAQLFFIVLRLNIGATF